MMQTVIEDFAKRRGEVENYLKILERLEMPGVVLFNQSTGRAQTVYTSDSLKVMKASAFLMVYNVVESSIRAAFDSFYKQLITEQLTAQEIRAELREVWVQQKFKKLDTTSASALKFREIATALMEEAVSGQNVVMESKLLPVSGNLDADRIRDVCHKHGVSIHVHRAALGGSEMKTIRVQRNALAHGNTSFSECGQQYTVSDLNRIHKQAMIFVRGVLKSIEKHVTNKAYAVKKVGN